MLDTESIVTIIVIADAYTQSILMPLTTNLDTVFQRYDNTMSYTPSLNEDTDFGNIIDSNTTNHGEANAFKL